MGIIEWMNTCCFSNNDSNVMCSINVVILLYDNCSICSGSHASQSTDEWHPRVMGYTTHEASDSART